jgi:hypothetical protein
VQLLPEGRFVLERLIMPSFRFTIDRGAGYKITFDGALEAVAGGWETAGVSAWRECGAASRSSITLDWITTELYIPPEGGDVYDQVEHDILNLSHRKAKKRQVR